MRKGKKVVHSLKGVVLGILVLLGGRTDAGEVKTEVKAIASGTYFATLMRPDLADELSVGTGVVSVNSTFSDFVGVGFMAGFWQIPVVGVEGTGTMPTDAAGEGGFSVFNAYAEVSLKKLGLPVSLQAGRITTNVGGELAFTTQNINIQRGLVWYGEPVFYNGIRATVVPENSPFSFYLGVIRGIFDAPDSRFAFEGGFSWSGESLSVALNTILSDSTEADATQLFDLVFGYQVGDISITLYGDLLFDAKFENPGVGVALLTAILPEEGLGIGSRLEYVINFTDQTDFWGTQGANVLTVTLTPTYKLGPGFVRIEVSTAFASEDIYADDEGELTGFQLRLGAEVGVEF